LCRFKLPEASPQSPFSVTKARGIIPDFYRNFGIFLMTIRKSPAAISRFLLGGNSGTANLLFAGKSDAA
jgi:hypothetical protein